MDGLQFGRHHQPATDDAWLIGKALAIASLGTEFLSSFVDHGPACFRAGEVGKGPGGPLDTRASRIPPASFARVRLSKSMLRRAASFGFGACTSSTKMPTTYRVTGDIFNVEDTLRFLHSDEKNFMNFFPLPVMFWRDVTKGKSHASVVCSAGFGAAAGLRLQPRQGNFLR